MTTDSQARQIQGIEGLLAERRKFEQWLAQLESRRDGTPAAVFAKVHGDYLARLAEAQQRLSAETGAVQTLVTDLETSLSTHERGIAAKTDERSEAELRASVGEYSGKEWEKLRLKFDAAVSELTSQRDAVARELATMRTLLAEAAAPVGEVPKAAEAAAPETPAAAVPASADGNAGQAPAATEGKDVDELAFLRSVLGRTTPLTNPSPHPAVEPPAEPAPSRPARASGATAARKSGATTVASDIVHDHGPELFAPPAEPADAPVRSKNSRVAEPRASGSFGSPTPRTSEAVRTLKCQECGTLNFPTEWYCERCGGELAAF